MARGGDEGVRTDPDKVDVSRRRARARSRFRTVNNKNDHLASHARRDNLESRSNNHRINLTLRQAPSSSMTMVSRSRPDGVRSSPRGALVEQEVSHVVDREAARPMAEEEEVVGAEDVEVRMEAVNALLQASKVRDRRARVKGRMDRTERPLRPRLPSRAFSRLCSRTDLNPPRSSARHVTLDCEVRMAMREA